MSRCCSVAAVACALAAACVPPKPPPCGPGMVVSSDDPSMCVADVPPEPPPMPKEHRPDRVVESVSVEGLAVTVVPEGNVGWIIQVQNDRDTATTIVWDQSTYVGTTGRTLGRLIRGDTRKINTDREQPPTPIPPRARMAEWCVPEAQAGLIGGRVPEVTGTDPGRLYLVFRDIDGNVDTWEGEVRFDSGAPGGND